MAWIQIRGRDVHVRLPRGAKLSEHDIKEIADMVDALERYSGTDSQILELVMGQNAANPIYRAAKAAYDKQKSKTDPEYDESEPSVQIRFARQAHEEYRAAARRSQSTATDPKELVTRPSHRGSHRVVPPVHSKQRKRAP